MLEVIVLNINNPYIKNIFVASGYLLLARNVRIIDGNARKYH